jgi:integrase
MNDIIIPENNFRALKPITEKHFIVRGKNLDSKTIKSIETVRRNFNIWNQDKKLSLDSAIDYLLYLKESGLKIRTLRKNKSHIKELFLSNLEGNLEELSTLIDIKLSRVKISSPNQNQVNKTVNKEDILLFLDNLSYKQSLFIKFLYNSGCRVSEMVEAELNDIRDLKNGETQIGIIGKNSKHGYLRIPTELFKEILDTFSFPDIKRRYLFHNRKSKTGKYSRQFIYKVVQKLFKGQKNFSPHNFRHSKATHLLKAGYTIREVADFLRHSRTQITSEFYDMNTISSESLLKEAI